MGNHQRGSTGPGCRVVRMGCLPGQARWSSLLPQASAELLEEVGCLRFEGRAQPGRQSQRGPGFPFVPLPYGSSPGCRDCRLLRVRRLSRRGSVQLFPN